MLLDPGLPQDHGLHVSRAHAVLPQLTRLGFVAVTVAGQVWRSFSVAMPSRVIQVSQPLAIRRKLPADAVHAAVLPLLLVAPVMAAAVCWLTAPARIEPGDGDRAGLVRNLVDNAVRHSPRGARVELRVSRPDGAPTLQGTMPVSASRPGRA